MCKMVSVLLLLSLLQQSGFVLLTDAQLLLVNTTYGFNILDYLFCVDVLVFC